MLKLDNLHVLQLKSCDDEMIGKYTCSAKNKMGNDRKSVFVDEVSLSNKIGFPSTVRRNVVGTEAIPLVSGLQNILSNKVVLFIALLFARFYNL